MRVECVAQEHNTMSPARAHTQNAHSEVKGSNYEATAPPTKTCTQNVGNVVHFLSQCLKCGVVIQIESKCKPSLSH